MENTGDNSNKEKLVLRNSSIISHTSLFLILISYIVLSGVKFSIFVALTMFVVIMIIAGLFIYFKRNINRSKSSENNVFYYMANDLSWRYVIYLSIFFFIALILGGTIKIVHEYSELIILNAFIIFIWAISANNPMVNFLIGKSVKLSDVFINNEVSQLSTEMNIKDPTVYILNTNNRIANAFEVNSKEAYVFITGYLMNILDYNEIIAVLAHELSHIKLRHNKKTSFINFITFIIIINFISLGLVTGNALLYFASPIFFILLLLFIFLGVPAIKRRNEIKADLNAVKYVNKQYLIDALEKISNIDKIPENVMKSLSLDHPSTAKRVKIIENSKS